MRGLVDGWLQGIGLGYAVPIFSAQSINTPESLSRLEVVDFPELGISDQNDRKKLFYLIQRVRLALKRAREDETSKSETRRTSTNAANKKNKSSGAPQADSAVAPLAANGELVPVEHHQPPPPQTTEVRFRDEPDVAPGVRETAKLRDAGGGGRARPTAQLGPTSGGARGGGGGGGGGGAHQTPQKEQRLPPSHRHPKTPHVDGTQNQQQHRNTDGVVQVVGEQPGGLSRDQPIDSRLGTTENTRPGGTAAAAATEEVAMVARQTVTPAVVPMMSQAAAIGAYHPPMRKKPTVVVDDGLGHVSHGDWGDGDNYGSGAGLQSQDLVAQLARQVQNALEPMDVVEKVGGGQGRGELDLRPLAPPPRAAARPPAKTSDRSSSSTLTPGKDRGGAYAKEKPVTRAMTRSTSVKVAGKPGAREIARTNSARTTRADEAPRTPGRESSRRRPVREVPSKRASPTSGEENAGLNLRRPAAPDVAPATRKYGASATSPARDTARERAAAAASGGVANKRAPRQSIRKTGVTPERGRGHGARGEIAAKAISAAVTYRNEPRAIPLERPRSQDPSVERVAILQRPQHQRRQTSAGRGINSSSSESERVAAAEVNVAVDERDSVGLSRRESEDAAGELAVRLISAHREDVRSALAAARKDMDLVSKADQDRHPTALIEYAREVEGVLGERLAAAARLRVALDSYVAMRQAARSARPTVSAGKGRRGRYTRTVVHA